MKNCLRDNHSRLNGLDYTKLWRSSSTEHEQFFTREKENWLLYIVHSAQHTQYICIWWWVSGKIENMSILYSGFFNVFLKCILNDTLTILRLHYTLIFCWQGCSFRTRSSAMQLHIIGTFKSTNKMILLKMPLLFLLKKLPNSSINTKNIGAFS